jgi:uncharacterized membrane protein YozB (DUF420 family)
MGDWLGYLQLTAKAKTGVNSNVVIAGVIVAFAGVATLLWLSITLFLWLGEKLDNAALAGLIVTLIFLVIALIAAAVVAISRRNAQQRAQAALDARKAASLFDPSYLTIGLEIGRTIGWRRVVALAGVALLASGLVKEWTARSGREDEDEYEDEDEEEKKDES